MSEWNVPIRVGEVFFVFTSFLIVDSWGIDVGTVLVLDKTGSFIGNRDFDPIKDAFLQWKYDIKGDRGHLSPFPFFPVFCQEVAIKVCNNIGDCFFSGVNIIAVDINVVLTFFYVNADIASRTSSA